MLVSVTEPLVFFLFLSQNHLSSPDNILFVCKAGMFIAAGWRSVIQEKTNQGCPAVSEHPAARPFRLQQTDFNQSQNQS